MAVIFINRFFHPDLSATSQLLTDLAFDLAGSGRSVAVITSRLRYDAPTGGSELAAREIVEGVALHRVWTSRFGRARLIGRAIDYLTFYLSASWRLYRLARSDDIVVAKTDPPLVSVVAAPICLVRGARLINWLQDVFPEVAEAHGLGRRWGVAYALLRWARTASLRAAAANVVIGHHMARRVEALGVRRDRIRLIANWADGEAVRPIAHADNPFRHALAVGDAFVVAYSGNLGRVHETATFVEAMVHLAAPAADGTPEARPVHWLFIGGGALTPSLEAEVSRRRIPRVTFLPHQPRSGLAQSLSAADAHLASLRPEFEGLIVPSKVSGATAAGRPILFVGDPEGEIGRLIARYECGRTIAPGDGKGLARAIIELARDPCRGADMGRRARVAFEAEFDRRIGHARWERLLDEVSRGPLPLR